MPEIPHSDLAIQARGLTKEFGHVLAVSELDLEPQPELLRFNYIEHLEVL